MLKTYRDEKSKVILPGDLLGASMYATAHRGESVLDLLNHLDIDYCTLGNHEFDAGGQRLSELMKASKFPWLGSNVRSSQNPSEMFCNTMDMDEFEIDTLKAGKIKVGVFGVCTSSTPELSIPGKTVVFENEFEHAARCVSTLKKNGCEVILAFTHLNIAQDKELAEKVPGINVVLGGHDHDPYLLVHRNCLIIKVN